MKKVMVVSTVGLIYDGITSTILAYISAMNKEGLEIYIASTIKEEAGIIKQLDENECHIVEFPSRRENTLSYFYALTRFIRKNKINVIHVHGNSGTMAIEMLAGWLGRCKKRIGHSHNTRCDQVKADKILRPVFNLLYTDAAACGKDAGKWLLGSRPFITFNNGRAIEKYRFNGTTRDRMRKKYELTDALVVGHVGGFFEQKNHVFLINVFRALLETTPSSKLVLIGDGPLKNDIEKSVADIEESVLFIGTTSTVEDYLQMMDVMILPSLFEGLPLVSIEWQINGLPAVLSDTITTDCKLTELIDFMSLNSSTEEWAEALSKTMEGRNREQDSIIAAECVKARGFDIVSNASKLRRIYLNE